MDKGTVSLRFIILSPSVHPGILDQLAITVKKHLNAGGEISIKAEETLFGHDFDAVIISKSGRRRILLRHEHPYLECLATLLFNSLMLVLRRKL